MTLRTRLLAGSVAVAVPLAAALFLLDEQVRLRDMTQNLARFVDAEVASGDAQRACGGGPPPPFPPPGAPPPGRGAPPQGPPPGRSGRPYSLFGYASDFTPVDPRAPEVPGELRATLGRADTASTTFATPEGRGVATAARLRDATPDCAIVLAILRPLPGVIRNEAVTLALVILSVLVAVWLTAGPVIGRMRRLAEDVRRSAASHYERPVAVSGSDELADLARAFNTAGGEVREHLQEVAAREEALRRYVADTTHDIALPLTVLKGILADLDAHADPASHTQTQVRDAIQEAHYLASLVRNLAASARLDAPATALDSRPVDLSALVERVVARHRAVAGARQVQLDYAVPESPVTADTDLTLLEQAVSNLVDNAVQYNRAGGHVAVVLDSRPDRFVLTVADDGPGVSAEELAALTARHYRGSEARTRRPDGQGLGLSIVSAAAERLQLTLKFERPEEGGLKATLEGKAHTSGDLAIS